MLFLSGTITAYVFYSHIYQPNLVLKYEKEMYVYIPTDATFEDVQRILSESGVVQKTSSFRWVAEQKRYIHRIKAGRYLLKNGMNNNELVNLLRSGRQTPVNVVFNNLRTKEQFAGTIAKQLELDSSVEGSDGPVNLPRVGHNEQTHPCTFVDKMLSI